jgi:hypothetical protein
VWLAVFAVAVLVGLADGEWPWHQVLLAVVAGILSVAYLGGGAAQFQTR